MMIVNIGAAIAKKKKSQFLWTLLRDLSSDIKIAVDFIACDLEFSPTTVESREKDGRRGLLGSF